MMYTGCVPLKLSDSWVHININLAKLINELFGTVYVETVTIKVSVHRLYRRGQRFQVHAH